MYIVDSACSCIGMEHVLIYRGDEQSVASDEVKKEDKPGIPDDFFYEYDELVSKPRITG